MTLKKYCYFFSGHFWCCYSVTEQHCVYNFLHSFMVYWHWSDFSYKESSLAKTTSLRLLKMEYFDRKAAFLRPNHLYFEGNIKGFLTHAHVIFPPTRLFLQITHAKRKPSGTKLQRIKNFNCKCVYIDTKQNSQQKLSKGK